MSLAGRIRDARKSAEMTLDELAVKAGVSKTYLWELEKDEAGEKKPSADVLLKIANALSTTIAHLMGLPTVKTDSRVVELSPSLIEFRDRMERQGAPLTEKDLHDLAMTCFREGQPTSADEWQSLYLVLARNAKRKK
jgi:transcriptional regulator with XRE-family HTH domain